MKHVVGRESVYNITQKKSWHYLVRFKCGQHNGVGGEIIRFLVAICSMVNTVS